MIEELLNYTQKITPILFNGKYVWMRQAIAEVFDYAPSTIGMILKDVPNAQLPQLGITNTPSFTKTAEETFNISIDSKMMSRIAKYKLITVYGMRHLIKHASRDTRLKEVIMPIVKHIQNCDPSILQEVDEAVVVKCDTLSKAFNVFEDAISSFKENCVKEIMGLKQEMIEVKKMNENYRNVIETMKNQFNAINTQWDLLDMAA